MTAVIDKGPAFGQRHVQVLLLFFAIIVNYLAKYNAGVAVVAMTNADTTNPNYDEYDWDEKQRSYILSSFFWGYFVTNLPGGSLARRFGIVRTMFVTTLSSAIFSILVPFCVPWGGWQVYCAIRVIQGLFQGPLFPCIHAYLAVWSPVPERNRLGALANTGVECGNLLAMYLSGVLASSNLGWPSVFYIPGVAGIAWCAIWLLFGANSPSRSRYTTPAECNYIISSKQLLKQQPPTAEVTDDKQPDVAAEATADAAADGKLTEMAVSDIPVPWKAILLSVPFLALLVARCAQSWGFSTLQMQLPSYMFGVLNMDMSDNAIYSALPYLASWIMSYVFLLCAEVLLTRQWLSLTALRRSFNSIAFFIPAVMLIGIGFLDEEQRVWAIVLMTANIGINASNTIGSSLNTIDLSPNHAGILMSIVNTVANMVPILTPLLVGVIVTNEHDRTQWQIVFLIAAIVFIVGNTIYLVYGVTDVQPWDDENFMRGQELHNEDGKAVGSDEAKAADMLPTPDKY